MSEIKIKRVENAGEYSAETSFEASGLDYLNEDLIGRLFGVKPVEKKPWQPPEVQLGSVAKNVGGVDWDVVAIYDNAGIPSIMHRFKKTTNAELFGGSTATHAAFIIDGKEYDEIYISVYENCEINGKPYSLPMQNPWTDITNDKAAKACFGKGEGWHMITAAEWGLLANISLKNGTLPHGNTACGRYHSNPEEHGETYDGGNKTLTGSGPATWTHDHTPEGVHDLCGNIWEMVRGLRIKDGRLQAAKNNDAALDIDLTEEGDCWQAILDDVGKPIRVSVNDEGDIAITAEPESEDMEYNYDGCEWEDVEMDCKSEQLKELALFPGEPKAYFYVDSTSGEYFPIRGGAWSRGANAGVFCTYLGNPRSLVNTSIGFRSAYFKKN